MSKLVASPREFTGTERYDVRRRLGAGGMGIVYEAYDRRRGHPIAIKTLGHGLDPVSLHRFKREFRALTDLSHRNLVALYELELGGDPPFFTMELIEGVDFLRWVRPEGRTSLDRLRRALAQLAAGLGALHTRQRLHRDIKPSNILVTEQERVVILDLGLVLELDRDPAERITRGGAAGTLAYMSPEQGLGRALHPAADWYAVGVLLYEALTGRSPHLGDPSGSFAGEWIAPRDPREIDPDVPVDLSHLCLRLLATDPEARPSGGEILRHLGPEVSIAETPRSGAFVGREGALAALAQARERTHAGGPVLVHVRGRSGMGKTALVRRFLESVSPRGMVLAGCCREQEQVPYKAFDGLVDDLVMQLGKRSDAEVEALLPRNLVPLLQIFPAFDRVAAVARAQRRIHAVTDVHELRRRAFEALRELLARISDRFELVLFIDDLQWSDRDSALLLHEITRPPDPPPFLAILAYRSEETIEPIASTMTIDLGGLEQHEAEELARLSGAGPELAEQIARESGGSPLFVQEMADARIGAATLDDLLSTKVRALPPAARELLSLVAVAGQPVEHSVLERAGIGSDHSKMLSTLRLARLVRSSGTASDDLVEAYHDRVREVMLAELTPGEAERCHGRLAETLSDPERIARHLEGAGDRARAAGAHVEAARRAAAALAFDRAALSLKRALDLAPDPKLRLELGDALVHAGRGVEAAHVFLEAARSAPRAEKLVLHHRAGEQLLASGHLEAGMQALEPVLAATDLTERGPLMMILRRMLLRLRRRRGEAKQVDPDRLFRIDVAWSLSIGLAVTDPMRALGYHTISLCDAFEVGDPMRLSRAFAAEAAFLGTISKHRPKRIVELFREADLLAEASGAPQAIAFVKGAIGIEAAMRGRWREAADRCEEAESVLLERCTGVAWDLGTVRHFGLLGRMMLGDLDLLKQRAPLVLRDAIERGDTYIACYVDGSFVSFVEGIMKDAPEETLRLTQDSIDRWPSKRFGSMHFWATWNRISALLYRADPAVLDVARQLFRDASSEGLLRVRHARIEATFSRARAHLLLGDRRAALADAGWLANEPQARGRGYARLIRASAGEDVKANLEDAVKELTEAEMKIHVAATRHALGATIGGDVGRTMSAKADDFMRSQGIRDPARFARMLAPVE